VANADPIYEDVLERDEVYNVLITKKQ